MNLRAEVEKEFHRLNTLVDKQQHQISVQQSQLARLAFRYGQACGGLQRLKDSGVPLDAETLDFIANQLKYYNEIINPAPAADPAT